MIKKTENTETQIASYIQKMTFEKLGLVKKEKKISFIGFAVSIRALLTSWRQGTVSCKGRAEVARSGKKPWKQKGTGRARAGTARSPLWRGGGVIHGPQPRVRKTRVNQKVRLNSFAVLLDRYIKQGAVYAADWVIEESVPKTKSAFSVLNGAQLANQKNVVLFLKAEDRIHYASFANIPNIHLMFFDQPNVYDLAKASHWLFLQKDLEQFKKMVTRWV
ncbi:50S ribosomal protein L4 [Candidatus Dependentiae bacterium]|nr:MAG: 50S ribosomal protein L4 [Candidatus Dependentiae bacterium]